MCGEEALGPCAVPDVAVGGWAVCKFDDGAIDDEVVEEGFAVLEGSCCC